MKTLIIMRGLQGSGKSTKARMLAHTLGGVIASADDFYMDQDGNYNYNPDLIPEAKQWCVKKVRNFMQAGQKWVILDNTNVTRYSMEPYLELAKEYGYRVRFSYPDTPWANNPAECAKRNVHKVPLEAILSFQARWEPEPEI